LAAGETFASSDFCSRRPLFTALLGGMLALTGGNLKASLALLCLITASSAYLVAREVQAALGGLAATLVLLVAFLFQRWYVATTLTEHLGMALGALAFALLWRSACSQRLPLLAGGAFLSALALNARAGAFFTLPALVLWTAFMPWRRPRRHAVALAVLGIVSAFAANLALTAAVGRRGAAFSNFSYVLYGLVSGGNWTRALEDHPELRELPERQRTGRVYALAVDAVRNEPARLLRGIGRAYGTFLLTPFTFSFAHNAKANLLLRLLSLLGLAACVRCRSRPWASLTLALFAGLLASVPFAPPWDADFMRAYAASIGVMGALPAVGLAFLTGRLRRDDTGEQTPNATGSRWLAAVALGLAALCFVGPLLGRALARPERALLPEMRDCADAAVFRVPPGSVVRVGHLDRTDPYRISISRFRRGLGDLNALYPGVERELRSLEPPFALFTTFTFPKHGYLLLALEGGAAESAQPGALLAACAERPRDPEADQLGLRRSRQARILSAAAR
jgi:hypothetical protein